MMRSLQKSVLLILSVSIMLTACVTHHYSLPLPENPIRELDLGNIYIHPTWIKEIKVDEKRLDLNSLLEAGKVFKIIQNTRQARIEKQVAKKQRYKAAVSSPLLTTTSETSTLDSSNNELTTERVKTQPTSDNSESSFLIDDISNDPEGLSAPFHDILYATANSILGGQSLQNLYNINNIPEGYGLYVIPTITSFNPGRITKNNYIGKVSLSIKAEPKDLRVVAVAPAGFTRVLSESISHLRQKGINLAFAAQTGTTSVAGGFEQIMEKMDKLSHILQQPDFSVTIEGHNKVTMFYHGKESFKGESTLQNASYNTEIIVMANIEKILGEQEPLVETDSTGSSVAKKNPPTFQSISLNQAMLNKNLSFLGGQTSAASSVGFLKYKWQWAYQPKYEYDKTNSLSTTQIWDNNNYGNESVVFLEELPVYTKPKEDIVVDSTTIFKDINKIKLSGENLNDSNLKISIYNQDGKIITPDSILQSNKHWLATINDKVRLSKLDKINIELELKNGELLTAYQVISKKLSKGANAENDKIVISDVSVLSVLNPNFISAHITLTNNKKFVPTVRINNSVVNIISQKIDDIKNKKENAFKVQIWVNYPIDRIINKKALSLSPKKYMLSLGNTSGDILYSEPHEAKW